MNREFKPNIGIALLFTSLTLLGTNASAVTFNVSNADEFQAALTTAGSNGGDDEIVLTPGTYGGNFKYTAGESAALTIRAGGDGEERAVLDGSSTYVLKIVPGCYRVDLSLERVDIINGKSEEAGGGLAFVSSIRTPIASSECDSQSTQTQVEQGSKSSLTLKSVSFENNYAKDGAGIRADGLSLADISDSTFIRNGFYLNPSLASNNPGGGGSAHLGLSADRLIFRSNFLGKVGLPFGGEVPSLGSNLFVKRSRSLVLEARQWNGVKTIRSLKIIGLRVSPRPWWQRRDGKLQRRNDTSPRPSFLGLEIADVIGNEFRDLSGTICK